MSKDKENKAKVDEVVKDDLKTNETQDKAKADKAADKTKTDKAKVDEVAPEGKDAKDEEKADKAAQNEPPAGEALKKDSGAADAVKDDKPEAKSKKKAKPKPKVIGGQPKTTSPKETERIIAQELMAKRGIRAVYKAGSVWFTSLEYAKESARKQGVTVKTFE